MCCHTHYPELRDINGELFPQASATVDDRCRCSLGNPCPRRATAEDLKCDVCSDRAGYRPQPTMSPEPDIVYTSDAEGNLTAIGQTKWRSEDFKYQEDEYITAMRRYVQERYGGELPMPGASPQDVPPAEP